MTPTSGPLGSDIRLVAIAGTSEGSNVSIQRLHSSGESIWLSPARQLRHIGIGMASTLHCTPCNSFPVKNDQNVVSLQDVHYADHISQKVYIPHHHLKILLSG